MFFFKRKRKAVILPRDKHNLSRRDIDHEALRILYRLSSLNYEGYLVGGSVRDLLLGRKPKDFDIGTDARPNEIKRNFRNCFLVGKRFRLAHIVFGKKVYETATFRKAPDPNSVADEHGLYQYEDNTYGTPEEDALRRDFTVNGLFYDIKTFAVIDWVGGLKDLDAKIIRSIGDPCVRFQEDPVRMMRAIRFAAKLGFTVSAADEKAIRKYASAIKQSSISRLGEEILRLFVKGATEQSFKLAYEYGLLEHLLPTTHAWLAADVGRPDMLWNVLHALDGYVNRTKSEPTTAIAFAALLLPMFEEELKIRECNPADRQLRRHLAETLCEPIVKQYKLPRAVWMTAVDILTDLSRFWEKPRLEGVRDVRFMMSGAWQETWLFAQALHLVMPCHVWHIKAWRTGSECVVTRAAESMTVKEKASNPTRHRRKRPRRRNSNLQNCEKKCENSAENA